MGTNFWLLLAFVSFVFASEKSNKKDISDFSDADFERLYEQWEENEEHLPEDELPEHKRKPPSFDVSNFDGKSPEDVLKMSKKGQSLMMFVTIAEFYLKGTPKREETEKIAALWRSSLFNNHIDVQNYIIEDNRALFVFKDGSQAWTAKDFIVVQDRCLEVTLEGRQYDGKAVEKTEL